MTACLSRQQLLTCNLFDSGLLQLTDSQNIAISGSIIDIAAEKFEITMKNQLVLRTIPRLVFMTGVLTIGAWKLMNNDSSMHTSSSLFASTHYRSSDSVDCHHFRGMFFPASRASEAFEFMWNHSFEKCDPKARNRWKPNAIRETAAWITTEGIIVQPWDGPIVDKNGNVVFPYMSNRFYTGKGGVSYNNYLPFDRDKMVVIFEGHEYEVIGQVHTHPAKLDDDGDLTQDQLISGLLNIPVYNINHAVIACSTGEVFGSVKRPSSLLFQKRRQTRQLVTASR